MAEKKKVYGLFGEEYNFLDDCVPWNRAERDLPTGLNGLPNTITILSLVKSVTIFDDETEDGIKEGVKLKDLKKGMIVADVAFWPKRVEPFLNSIRIVEADGGQEKTLEEWYNTISYDGVNPRHTNGMAMWALTKIRTLLSTTGKVKV